MKTFKTLAITCVVSIAIAGGITLYNELQAYEKEQDAKALQLCRVKSFKGYVKFKGGFNVYKCDGFKSMTLLDN